MVDDEIESTVARTDVIVYLNSGSQVRVASVPRPAATKFVMEWERNFNRIRTFSIRSPDRCYSFLLDQVEAITW